MTCRAQSNQGGDRATWTGHPDFAVCTTGAVCASSRQENQSGLEVNGTRGNSIDLKIAMLRQNCGLKVPRNCLVYQKLRTVPPFSRAGPRPGCLPPPAAGAYTFVPGDSFHENINRSWRGLTIEPCPRGGRRPLIFFLRLARAQRRLTLKLTRPSSACHRSTSPNQKALSLALRAAAARRRHSSARRRNSSWDLA